MNVMHKKSNNYAFIDSQNLNLHVMIEYSNYDKAVIVTGDGDSHCLVDHLKK
jgi:uncharacterized LabA/DUF88 family protein